jgi:hypothetical protein
MVYFLSVWFMLHHDPHYRGFCSQELSNPMIKLYCLPGYSRDYGSLGISVAKGRVHPTPSMAISKPLRL